MERYDMYCQICDANIYNAICDWMFGLHYSCPQFWDNCRLVKDVYPRVKFRVFLKDEKIGEIILSGDKSLLKKYENAIKIHIIGLLKNNGNLVHFCCNETRNMSVDEIKIHSDDFFKRFYWKDEKFTSEGKEQKERREQREKEVGLELLRFASRLRVPTFPESLTGVVIFYEYSKKDDYLKEAGLIKHKTHEMNGRNIFDYNICPDCAKRLGFKCNLCNRELKKEKH